MNCLVCDRPSINLFLEVDDKIYWKCDHCLVIFLDQKFRLSLPEEKNRYQQHNNDIHDKDYRLFLSKLFNPLKLKLQPESKGLDYGCGPGPALAEMFLEEGFKMDIYDPFFYKDERIFSKTYDFITGKQSFIERMISYFPKEEKAIAFALLFINHLLTGIVVTKFPGPAKPTKPIIINNKIICHE